jgi:hypothetical protein
MTTQSPPVIRKSPAQSGVRYVSLPVGEGRGGVFIASGVRFEGRSYFAPRGAASRQPSVVSAVSVESVFQFSPRRSDRYRQHDNSIAPGYSKSRARSGVIYGSPPSGGGVGGGVSIASRVRFEGRLYFAPRGEASRHWRSLASHKKQWRHNRSHAAIPLICQSSPARSGVRLRLPLSTGESLSRL